MSRPTKRKKAVSGAGRVAAYRLRRNEQGLCITSGCSNKVDGGYCPDCRDKRRVAAQRYRARAAAALLANKDP